MAKAEPWTPGPWTYRLETETYFIFAKDGTYDLPRTEADARLIALAPEMAKLAEHLLALDLGDTATLAGLQVRARNLLARARGEAS